MKIREKLTVLALVAGTFALTAGQAAAQDTTSAVLANTCFSCHGTEGKSQGAMPVLAGRPASYIKVTLNQYREDKKQGTVMNRIAKGFTAEEIESLSRFFASQK